MPIYEFTCRKCANRFEEILPSADISSVVCPGCASPDVKKVVSAGTIRVGTRTPAPPSGTRAGGACRSGFT